MAKVASSQWLSESMRPFPFQCFIISLDKGYVPEKLWKLYIIDKKSISHIGGLYVQSNIQKRR